MKIPTAWQIRVIEERAELCVKADNLEQYLSGGHTIGVDLKELELLHKQLSAMRSYIAVLAERIALW